MNILDTLGVVLKTAIDAWAMIPWWVQILLLIAAVWFSFFKTKAPQRVAKLWHAGFASAWFSGQKDNIENVDEINKWAGGEVDKALKGDMTFVKMPEIKYKRKDPVDWSFRATYNDASPTMKMVFNILIASAILVTLAMLIVLPLKAFGVF